MKKEFKTTLPYKLQFFADGDDQSGNGNENGEQDQTSDDDNNSGEKTFTQTQVSAMMTKEKNEGKRSVLKSLGFKNEEEAKSAIAAYKAFVDSQKSEQEKNADDVKNAKDEASEAISRAVVAENKLTCFEAGVSKDSIDDVLAIASTKVTESKDLSQVLKEMKKDSRYSGFFKTEEGKSASGTGTSPGHSSGASKGDAGDLGKRLAGGTKQDNVKSSFFN